MLDVKAGDTVFLSEYGARPKAVTVHRVAKKYLYLKEYGREEAFSLETGQSKTRTAGAGAYIRTVAQVEEANRRKEALKALMLHGVVLDSLRSYHLTLEQLETLAEVARTFPIRER